jgi:hypothetical protein
MMVRTRMMKVVIAIMKMTSKQTFCYHEILSTSVASGRLLCTSSTSCCVYISYQYWWTVLVCKIFLTKVGFDSYDQVDIQQK